LTVASRRREVDRLKAEHAKTGAELRRVMGRTVEDYLAGRLGAKAAARVFLKLDTPIPEKPEPVEDALMRLTLLDQPAHGGPARGELAQILAQLRASL
jgi:hypothetical protein